MFPVRASDEHTKLMSSAGVTKIPWPRRPAIEHRDTSDLVASEPQDLGGTVITKKNPTVCPNCNTYAGILPP
jgi:hypothetical protein